MTQIKAHLMEKPLKLSIPSLCFNWLNKELFGHYAILKHSSFISPSSKNILPHVLQALQSDMAAYQDIRMTENFLSVAKLHKYRFKLNA